MPAAPPLVLHTESSVGFGGQEIRILTEARWLLAHGWRAVLACQPKSRIHAEALTAGVPTVPVRMRHTLDLRAMLDLRRLMRQQDIALVHTHSSIDSWLATLAARSLRRPVVRGRHVTIPIKRRRALIYHLADRVITSADAVKALVEAVGVRSQRIVTIPAGVDADRFHPGVSGRPVREELGLHGPVVGLVANVRSSKGHRYFLEAAREVVRTMAGVRFLVVGDGVGLEEVRRGVGELGLETHVLLTGFRRDVPAVIAALDVLVLPSIRSEAISQVVLQALAIGTPVVVTAIGGSPEVVHHGRTGLVVAPGDAAALADAILQLLGDPERARVMAAAGREFVRASLTMDRMMERTVAIYAELVGRASAPAWA